MRLKRSQRWTSTCRLELSRQSTPARIMKVSTRYWTSKMRNGQRIMLSFITETKYLPTTKSRTGRESKSALRVARVYPQRLWSLQTLTERNADCLLRIDHLKTSLLDLLRWTLFPIALGHAILSCLALMVSRTQWKHEHNYRKRAPMLLLELQTIRARDSRLKLSHQQTLSHRALR